MKNLWLAYAATALCLTLSPTATAEQPQTIPFSSGEVLRYEIVWPTGLSFGEAEFRATSSQAGWKFRAELSASLPNFEVLDEYVAEADHALCSQQLNKDSLHGSRQTHEEITFDQKARIARRESVGGGGISEFTIPPCARDALTALYALRSDLAAGRIPPPDDLVFGALYGIVVTYAETRRIEVAGEMREADRLLVDISGPEASHNFEIFFGKDAARTPLLVKVPFSLGVFSLKLVE